MLSTVHTSQMAMVTRSWGPDGNKPQCVVDYNIRMKGVDLGDQFSNSYPSVRGSLKWYKLLLLFFYLFDLATVNSRAIYKYLGNRAPQLDFRLRLGNAIISQYRTDVKPYHTWGRPAILSSASWLQRRKWHIVWETPGWCFLCYWAGVRKMTRTMWLECKVSLCTYRCFEQHHSQRRL